jgi:hypothetical protein
MDAGHTVRSHATFVTEEMLAHYVMTVKENTKGLFDRIDALDWAAVPVSHTTVDKGHGRRERRTIQVMPAPADLGFPHAAQVFLIERYTTRTVRKRQGQPKVQEGSGLQRRRGAGCDQPVRPRGRGRAPGHLRTGALVDREQGPLGPGCHIP